MPTFVPLKNNAGLAPEKDEGFYPEDNVGFAQALLRLRPGKRLEESLEHVLDAVL